MSKKKKANIERICGNCRLYDPQKNQCSVVVLHEGKRIHLPVESKDSCFYEENYFDPNTKAMENFADDLKEVKFWVENEKGEKTDGNGIVKMEYEEGFFGKTTSEDQNPKDNHSPYDFGSFSGSGS